MHALENLPISNRFPRTLAASALLSTGGERRVECIRAMNPLLAPPSALLRPRYQQRPRFPRGLYFMQIFRF